MTTHFLRQELASSTPSVPSVSVNAYAYTATLPRPLFACYATLHEPASFRGVGLHSGQPVVMNVLPIDPKSRMHGVFFSLQQTSIPAHWQHVYDTTLSTNLKNGSVCVRTVEHILSALFMAGISSAIIELSAPEVPIMDGSAAPFLEKLKPCTLQQERPFVKVLKTIRVEHPKDPSVWAQISPYDGLKLSISINFEGAALIGQQSLEVDVYRDDLPALVGSARTFVLEKDVLALQKAGLARGGSLENAIVVRSESVLNPEGLRAADECVRHKMLDCIGDLALAGAPLLGHLQASKPGHQLNLSLLKMLFSQSENWTYAYPKYLS